MNELGLDEEGDQSADSRDMLMGDLVMVAMLLTTSDNEISKSELEIINDFRRLVYGNDTTDIDASDCRGIYKELLRHYPDQIITLDHMPISVRRLQIFDYDHGTDHAERAKALLLTFGEEVVKADKGIRPDEDITLANFRETLYRA